MTAYGHAERTLAAIRLIEAETAESLRSLPQLNAEQSRWLQEVTQAADPGWSSRPGSGAPVT